MVGMALEMCVRIKVEPWRVVANSHHFDKEQDPVPEVKIPIRIRIKVERRIRIRLNVKWGIQIRINVMRILNSQHYIEAKQRKNDENNFFQCSGSGSTGSTCFWASRIRSTSQRYGSGSGSGSFYHHAKIELFSNGCCEFSYLRALLTRPEWLNPVNLGLCRGPILSEGVKKLKLCRQNTFIRFKFTCVFLDSYVCRHNAGSQPPNPHNGECKTKSNLLQKKISALYKEHFRVRKPADLFKIFPDHTRFSQIWIQLKRKFYHLPISMRVPDLPLRAVSTLPTWTSVAGT